MRYLFNSVLCCLIFALTSCDMAPWSYDIGEGLVLVQTPPQFKTVTDNRSCVQLLEAIELDVTPDISETIMETVVVQEGSHEVVVMPIKYNRGRSVKAAAKVRFRTIPAVTKQVTYPAIKTSSAELRRKADANCQPITRRVVWTPATYKIKDESGTTIRDFETVEDLAAYINAK